MQLGRLQLALAALAASLLITSDVSALPFGVTRIRYGAGRRAVAEVILPRSEIANATETITGAAEATATEAAVESVSEEVTATESVAEEATATESVAGEATATESAAESATVEATATESAAGEATATETAIEEATATETATEEATATETAAAEETATATTDAAEATATAFKGDKPVDISEIPRINNWDTCQQFLSNQGINIFINQINVVEVVVQQVTVIQIIIDNNGRERRRQIGHAFPGPNTYWPEFDQSRNGNNNNDNNNNNKGPKNSGPGGVQVITIG